MEGARGEQLLSALPPRLEDEIRGAARSSWHARRVGAMHTNRATPAMRPPRPGGEEAEWSTWEYDVAQPGRGGSTATQPSWDGAWQTRLEFAAATMAPLDDCTSANRSGGCRPPAGAEVGTADDSRKRGESAEGGRAGAGEKGVARTAADAGGGVPGGRAGRREGRRHQGGHPQRETMAVRAVAWWGGAGAARADRGGARPHRPRAARGGRGGRSKDTKDGLAKLPAARTRQARLAQRLTHFRRAPTPTYFGVGSRLLTHAHRLDQLRRFLSVRPDVGLELGLRTRCRECPVLQT